MAEENVKKLLEDYKDDTKRHFDVVGESLKHEIQLVAEGVSSANESIDRMDEKIDRMDERVDRIEQDVGVIKEDIAVMKVDVEFIKNELVQKVSREEFVILEKRVSAVEAKLHQRT